MIKGKTATTLFHILTLVAILFPYQSPAKNTDMENDDYFEVSSDSAKIDLSIYKKNGEYIITDTLDLLQKTLYLPDGVSLVVNKGLFVNGCIVGRNTHLKYEDTVFDRVHIKGSWIVPRINTSMFRNLSYDNSLSNVLALANPQILNQIHIQKGRYRVSATDFSSRCLTIISNTKLIIDGTIYIIANDLTGYSILFISGNNIFISGDGCIEGDKFIHKNTLGEWGMGIDIAGGENISICGLKIYNCWGDCIYISRNAKDVTIEDCLLDNGRRQGISIISAQNVIVRKCKITNINGTNPAYAIDVEPNQGDVVRNVKIEKVEVNNCRGGFESNGNAKDALIENVFINKCTITNTKRWPLRFIQTKGVRIDVCRINRFKSPQVVFLAMQMMHM